MEILKVSVVLHSLNNKNHKNFWFYIVVRQRIQGSTDLET